MSVCLTPSPLPCRVVSLLLNSIVGIYGFHGNKKQPFLKIIMAVPRLLAAAKRLLEGGFSFGSYPPQEYQVYESNTEFEIRYVLSTIPSLTG